MIHILTENITPRLQWISHVLFKRMLGVDIKLTDDIAHFNKHKSFKINYTTIEIKDIPQVIPHAILFEKDIHSQTIEVRQANDYSFFGNDDQFMGFDFLAASFYLLSRYEEYLPHEIDQHGRYAFKNSLAAAHGFITLPIVDLWMQRIKAKMIREFEDLRFTETGFRIIPTMDVDVAYAYKGRSPFRNLRATAKDVITANTQRLKQRQGVKKGGIDPFDTYDYYQGLMRKYKLESKFFFLLGDYGEFDKNLHYDTPALIHLIQQKGSQSGSHLSYGSHKSPDIASEEKRRLQAILSDKVCHNRFHYLKFSVKHSYPLLVKLGYTADYSMAYPETPGFRSSTSYPYPFFDLIKNQEEELLIYPTTVMDASCQGYLKLSPDESLALITDLIDNIAAVGGCFIPLWHNDSLSDEGKWNGWKTVLDKSLAYAQKKL